MNKRKSDESVFDHAGSSKQIKTVHDNIFLEKSALKFDFMTSLQNIAIAKIVTTLWMHQSTQKEIVDLFHKSINFERKAESDEILPYFDSSSFISNQWQKIENNVFSHVYQLPLPKLMVRNLRNIVPLIGKFIFKWIRYTNKFIFETDPDSHYSAVDFISYIRWTPRGKIDFAQTAKNILSNQGNYLSDDHKYKIACSVCLEDEIAIIAPNAIKEYDSNSVMADIHPMIYYWTGHITGDNTPLYDVSNYFDTSYHGVFSELNEFLSSNELIFNLLVFNAKSTESRFNEVPIRYMWSKLSEKEKTRNLFLIFTELGNRDLRCSLLSDLSYAEQKEVFKKYSNFILFGILNDWLWGKYFLPTAIHFLDVMEPLTYFSILKKVNKLKTESWQEESVYMYDDYKYILKQLWQNGSKQLKDFILEHEKGRAIFEHEKDL